MRRSVLVRNAPVVGVSTVAPQFAARRRNELGIVALLSCMALSLMLTGCIQSGSSGSSNPLAVQVSNGSSQRAVVGTVYGAPLIAVVGRADGKPVSGVTVTFTAPSSGASGTFANGQLTETHSSDSNGLVTSSALKANSTSGEFQVTATASGAAVNASFGLENLSTSDLRISVNNGSLQNANVGTAFAMPLIVRVTNNGTGVQGVTVTFTAPSSGASGTFANKTATENDVTDSNGYATSSTFTANNTVGSYQVMASIPDVTPVTLYLTNTAGSGVPAVVQAESGTPQTTTVSSAFAPLVAGVADGTGAPLSGVSVTFTAPSTGASAKFASSGTNIETDVTNSNGLATSSTLTANSTTGTFTVNATVAGVAAPAAFSLTNSTSSSPAAVIATGGTPQRAAISSSFSAKLVATVVDAAGIPLSGVSVTFAAPASGASGSFPGGATVTTDTNGNATAAFTANSTAGTYTVTATAGSLTPANFALMNTVARVTAYSFYLSGEEEINSQNSGHLNYYALVGTILVDPIGVVVGGEEDYNDAAGLTFTTVGITTGSLSFSTGDPAGQGTLTLFTNQNQIGINGTETFKVQFVNTNHALIIQFDDTATSSGSMDVQNLGTPSGGYAFTLSGVDPLYLPVGFGGVFASGGTVLNPTWPGIIDVSDAPSPGLGVLTNNPFTASLGSIDVYGRGVITGISIPVTGQSPQNLNIAYYLVGTKALRLIDIDSSITAAGSAFSQGANATSAANAGLGQSVFAVASNTNVLNTTYFVTLGQFSTSNTSSQTADLAGVADEDELAQPIKTAAITGTYQIQSNGYGTLSITSANLGSVTSLGVYLTDPALNLSDPNNSTSGVGGALLLDLDATLTGGTGIITPQTDTAESSFAGNYAVGWQDINELDGAQNPREFDMLAQGSMVANGQLSVTGAFGDPFETLSNLGTLSTGDTCQTVPQVDSSNLGSGRYSMLEANHPGNPLNCELNFTTQVPVNFELIMYQASGDQLFWYQRAIQPNRPAQLFLGPLELQGSLNGIPSAWKGNGRLKSTRTPAVPFKPDAQ